MNFFLLKTYASILSQGYRKSAFFVHFDITFYFPSFSGFETSQLFQNSGQIYFKHNLESKNDVMGEKVYP